MINGHTEIFIEIFQSHWSGINGLEILETTLSAEKIYIFSNKCRIISWKIFNKFKRPKQLAKRFLLFDDGPIKALTKYQDGIAFIFDENDNDPAKVYHIFPNEEFYSYNNLDISIPTEFEEMVFE